MDEYTLKTFIDNAPEDVLQQFADKVCNGSMNYLKYQIGGGHRAFSFAKAQQAHRVAKALGYHIPLHNIRPDIWEAA